MTAMEMDPGSTRSGLSSSDASASTQPGSGLGGLPVGAYTTPLVSAIGTAQAARQASAQIRVAVNTVNREVSVASVEAAEAANSGALST
ncbi:hypothetical protein F0Q45_21400 [Mycobacterium simiae]|uniref:PE family protein n=1 Tax=Mycobacterium simiae TaxID=1784 RepID=A0A5B1BJM7_MYCSI|nr:hypothetical protein [Mycobacterium simiae]KAA1248292.1 hypothetical protein F0Q45_21400 [Mycobacterium simiae]